MNDLIAAWRNLSRNSFHSAVTIFGLTIGLTACFIVFTVITDELSYDTQWSKKDRLYRIISVNKVGQGLYNENSYSFEALPPALKKKFPEVEEYSGFTPTDLRLQVRGLKNEGLKTDVLMADTAIFHMLDIHIIEGTPATLKEGYTNLILTKSFAEKYFPGKNVIGNILYEKATYADKPTAYIVTGIIEDLPLNSHLRAEVLVLGARGNEGELNPKQGGTMSAQYLLMRAGTDMKQFTAKVNKWYKSVITADNPLTYTFQPISKIYLDSPFATNQKVRGERQRIIIFSAVAALLFIIACINFINLSTARAASRMGDTCVRKILGARRMHLIKRMLTETLLFFGISTTVAIVLYSLALPYVETFLGYSLGRTVFNDPFLSSYMLGALIVAALISGMYPALLISSFRPAGILKGSLMSSRSTGRSLMRQALVVVQFSLCICILIAMIVVHRQLRYMDEADIGYDKNNLINIGLISWDGKGEVFKNALNLVPGVVSSSHCIWTPSRGPGYMMSTVEDPLHPGNRTNVWHLTGDVDFAKTLGLRLKEGRYLNNRFKADVAEERRNCLITSTTATLLDIHELNKYLKSVEGTPVGIIDDFHTQSFHEPLGPTVVTADSTVPFANMLIRVEAGSEDHVRMAIRNIWQKLYPEKLLELNMVDELLDTQYEREQKLRQLFTFFGVLTMLLASLGIFGLILHNVQERIKEIAIRKVLGGSVLSIAWLLSSRFSLLVAVSIAIASPVGMWCMNKWLQSFAYRITPGWSIAITAGVIALIIALLTAGGQAVKAALANPVRNLRNE